MSCALLSPRVDFVFKKIFGNKNHPKILISFLNAVMKPTEPIVDVKILNSDIEKEYLEDKYSRLDIRATTNVGEQINIEIQVKNEYNMISRTLYYWSKMFEEQLDQGENYNKLARTVCINILDFKYLKNHRFHNAYRLKEITTNEELTNLQEIHFIELPKMKELDKYADTTDMLEIWIEFIKNPSSKKVESLEMSVKEIKEAKEELVRLSSDEDERMAYDRRKMAILDRVSDLENAENKGKEKGIKEGEKIKSLEIAKNLIKMGLDLESIVNATNLSIDQLNTLKVLLQKK